MFRRSSVRRRLRSWTPGSIFSVLCRADSFTSGREETASSAHGRRHWADADKKPWQPVGQTGRRSSRSVARCCGCHCIIDSQSSVLTSNNIGTCAATSNLSFTPESARDVQVLQNQKFLTVSYIILFVLLYLYRWIQYIALMILLHLRYSGNFVLCINKFYFSWSIPMLRTPVQPCLWGIYMFFPF